MVRVTFQATAPLVLMVLASCGGGSAPAGASLAIVVLPLALEDVTEARYTITVLAGADTVWTRTLDSNAYGDGAGSLTYVGPCDATRSPNTVRLVLEGLRTPSGWLVDGVDFVNPAPSNGPIERLAECRESADTEVAFDLTIARSADQGFFDIGVEFEDIFCSAKLDCLRDDGGPLELLFDPRTDTRAQTAVVALACTAGPGAEATWLHLDDVEITCAGGATFTVDVAAGPGNLDPWFPFGASAPNTTHLLFQSAVYRGREAFAEVDKGYWHVALGLNADAFAALGPCTLTTSATASDGPLVAGATDPEAIWPLIDWSREIVSATGALTCARHALGDGSGVGVVYTGPGGAALDASFAPRSGLVVRHNPSSIPGAYDVLASPRGPSRHIIDGLFTGFPDPDGHFEWSTAVPRAGPDADYFYFDYDGQWLAGIMEGFTCPDALDDDEGVHLAISTDGGDAGWLLHLTPLGVASAILNGVDVTAQGLAQARIALATSPHSPETPHYLIEFEVPAAPGGFSYRVVGADAACAVPASDLFIYGTCPPGGGIWPPLPSEPRAGTPIPGGAVAGGVVRVPGSFGGEVPSITVAGVAADPIHIDPDDLMFGLGDLVPGPVEILLCYSAGCVRHVVYVYGANETLVIGQPAAPVGQVDGLFGGGGSVSFLWGGMPVRGQRTFFCGCGHHDDMPCMMLSWDGGTFGPDADKLIVYGGTADGQRLAVVGHQSGQVEAWFNGLPLSGTVGALTQSYSPWSGDEAIVMEVCLPLPWSTYVIGVTGPCDSGYCDEPQAIDVRSWYGGRYTEQSPTSDPRIVVVGPGTDPLAGAKAQGGLGTAGGDSFVVRGANLGVTGTALFEGAIAGPAGLAWSETVVTGTLPAQAQDGPLALAGSHGTSNAVTVSVAAPPPPTPSCVYVRDVLGGTTSGIHSYDADGSGPEPAYPIYCDQDTDGGGWVLIAYWTSGTDDYRLWNDVAVAGRAMRPYSANTTLYPVPPGGILNTYTEQRFATTISWFTSAYGAWVRYPIFSDPMPAVGGAGFAGVSALGTQVTLRTAEPSWGHPTGGSNTWSLWTSACGGADNCGSRSCPALRPYDNYPCHYDVWAPKFLFAREIPQCGDGVAHPGETCDDQNTLAGDGCSASCLIEPGFVCSGWPSSCALDVAGTTCEQARLAGRTTSGVYAIDPDGPGGNPPFRVWCDQTSDGGGWTVFQRRHSASDFYRSWAEYASGFGDAADNYWLGHDRIADFTARFPSELRVDLTFGGQPYHAEYATFLVGTAATQYQLSLGAYSGDAGDALTYHHGAPFTTFDSDHDTHAAGGNCAIDHSGAWWYKSCHQANLNGVWASTSNGDGVIWYWLTGHTASATSTEMKMRER